MKVTTILIMFMFIPAAFANLCNPKHIKKRHKNEADELISRTFSVSPYTGAGEDYDSHLIACNRKRDGLGKKIEKNHNARHDYRRNLAPRIIKGHIKYYGFAGMRYGYMLERKNGEWIVTVVAEFHFPKKKFPKKLDIPQVLASDLGIYNTICASTRRSGLNITRGHVALGYSDRMYDSCRVKRNERFNGVKATTHLMKYWKRHIKAYWSHQGFKVNFKIVNLNQVSDSLLKKFKKRNAVWHIRLNHNKSSRAMYRASIGRPHPLYAGLNHYIINHEFGHILGLDDEYHDKTNVPNWKKCEDNGGSEYVMCNSWGDDNEHVKGVYPWMVTRRYSTGKPLSDL